MKRILFPTDLSEHAAAALPHAINLAALEGGELHLLHILALHGPSSPLMEELTGEDQARAALDGDCIPADPSVEERFEICLEHARNGIRYEDNSKKSLIEFRKHLGWYTKGLPGGRALRTQLFQITSLDEVEVLLEAYLVRHLAGANEAA